MKAFIKIQYMKPLLQALIICLRKKIRSQGRHFQSIKHAFTLRIDVLPQAIVLPFCLLLISCSPPSDREGSLLTYAKEFNLKKLPGGGKVVEDSMGAVHQLTLNGQAQKKEDAHHIIIPLNHVIALSTPMASYMRSLDVLDTLVAVTTKADLWYIPHVKQGLLNGSITQLGQSSSFDLEAIVALKPQMVFAAKDSHLKGLEKLAELNIPHAYVHQYLEPHPLGQAEWIRFFGAFFHKDKKAAEQFDRIEKNTAEILKKVGHSNQKLGVIWGNVFKGRAFVPGGDSYVARLITLAGGNYLFSHLKGTGSIQITIEAFYASGKEADIYILSSTENYTPSMDTLLQRAIIFSELKPVKEKKVWCYQPWYWQSRDKMDEVINDMAAILYPDRFQDYHLKHFTRLKEGASGDKTP